MSELLAHDDDDVSLADDSNVVGSLRTMKLPMSPMMTMILGMDQVVVNLMEKILTQPHSLMAGTKVTRRRKVGEMTIQRTIGSKEEAT